MCSKDYTRVSQIFWERPGGLTVWKRTAPLLRHTSEASARCPGSWEKPGRCFCLCFWGLHYHTCWPRSAGTQPAWSVSSPRATGGTGIRFLCFLLSSPTWPARHHKFLLLMIHACTFSTLTSPQIPHSPYCWGSPSSSFCLSLPPWDPEAATTTPQHPAGARWHHFFAAAQIPGTSCYNQQVSVVLVVVQLHKDAATSTDSPAHLQLRILHTSVVSSVLASSFHLRGHNVMQSEGLCSTKNDWRSFPGKWVFQTESLEGDEFMLWYLFKTRKKKFWMSFFQNKVSQWTFVPCSCQKKSRTQSSTHVQSRKTAPLGHRPPPSCSNVIREEDQKRQALKTQFK